MCDVIVVQIPLKEKKCQNHLLINDSQLDDM